MVKFDPSNAECLVFVYKQGVLSTLAHDLRLQVTDFCLDVDEARRTLTARASSSSLRVDCAMRDGAEAEKPLSAGDVKTIESVIVKDVLHSDKYPEIRFLSTCIADIEGGYDVTGTLTLHGVTKQIAARARPDGGRLVVEMPIQQPDCEIKPYSFLLGAFKAKPEVTVRLAVTL
jgi:polyisoprenoid-binding protein YceI